MSNVLLPVLPMFNCLVSYFDCSAIRPFLSRFYRVERDSVGLRGHWMKRKWWWWKWWEGEGERWVQRWDEVPAGNSGQDRHRRDGNCRALQVKPYRSQLSQPAGIREDAGDEVLQQDPGDDGLVVGAGHMIN